MTFSIYCKCSKRKIRNNFGNHIGADGSKSLSGESLVGWTKCRNHALCPSRAQSTGQTVPQ